MTNQGWSAHKTIKNSTRSSYEINLKLNEWMKVPMVPSILEDFIIPIYWTKVPILLPKLHFWAAPLQIPPSQLARPQGSKNSLKVILRLLRLQSLVSTHGTKQQNPEASKENNETPGGLPGIFVQKLFDERNLKWNATVWFHQLGWFFANLDVPLFVIPGVFLIFPWYWSIFA